ncbi:MAG: sulfurtransferase TusA family protein [Pirellulales bacterium]
MDEPINVAAEWDAGPLGCSALVAGICARIEPLAPGEVLKVIARDSAASFDIPAWCRLTGHRLARAAHPHYFVERKGE